MTERVVQEVLLSFFFNLGFLLLFCFLVNMQSLPLACPNSNVDPSEDVVQKSHILHLLLLLWYCVKTETRPKKSGVKWTYGQPFLSTLSFLMQLIFRLVLSLRVTRNLGNPVGRWASFYREYEGGTMATTELTSSSQGRYFGSARVVVWSNQSVSLGGMFCCQYQKFRLAFLHLSTCRVWDGARLCCCFVSCATPTPHVVFWPFSHLDTDIMGQWECTRVHYIFIQIISSTWLKQFFITLMESFILWISTTLLVIS